MTSRPRGALAAVIALAAVAGGGVVAMQDEVSIFPKPVVAVSTLTIPGGDYVGLVVTAFPKCVRSLGRSVCPQRLDFRGRLQSDDGFMELEGSRVASRNGAKDTLLVPRPPCPMFGRVTGYVAAEARGAVERSDRGASTVSIPCRPMTAADEAYRVAILDTFPEADQRLTFSSRWGYKIEADERAIMELEDVRAARTAADTARQRQKWADVREGADSVFMAPVGDTLRAAIGYAYKLCWLARNRFTSEVDIVDGDVVRCDAVRRAFQSERSS